MHCASDRELNASEPVVQGDGMIQLERGGEQQRARSKRAVGVLSGGGRGGKINFICCIYSPIRDVLLHSR